MNKAYGKFGTALKGKIFHLLSFNNLRVPKEQKVYSMK
jgi:hypothetical protein